MIHIWVVRVEPRQTSTLVGGFPGFLHLKKKNTWNSHISYVIYMKYNAQTLLLILYLKKLKQDSSKYHIWLCKRTSCCWSSDVIQRWYLTLLCDAHNHNKALKSQKREACEAPLRPRIYIWLIILWFQFCYEKGCEQRQAIFWFRSRNTLALVKLQTLPGWSSIWWNLVLGFGRICVQEPDNWGRLTQIGMWYIF